MKLTNRINLPSPRRSKMAVYPAGENAGGIAFTLWPLDLQFISH